MASSNFNKNPIETIPEKLAAFNIIVEKFKTSHFENPKLTHELPENFHYLPNFIKNTWKKVRIILENEHQEYIEKKRQQSTAFLVFTERDPKKRALFDIAFDIENSNLYSNYPFKIRVDLENLIETLTKDSLDKIIVNEITDEDEELREQIVKLHGDELARKKLENLLYYLTENIQELREEPWGTRSPQVFKNILKDLPVYDAWANVVNGLNAHTKSKRFSYSFFNKPTIIVLKSFLEIIDELEIFTRECVTNKKCDEKKLTEFKLRIDEGLKGKILEPDYERSEDDVSLNQCNR